MSILLRRREFIRDSQKLMIYDTGKILSGYAIEKGGAYGGGSQRVTDWFFLNSDHIYIKCYDGTTSNPSGCAFVVTPGLDREFLSQYSTINITAYINYSTYNHLKNYEVGIYPSTSLVYTNVIKVSKISNKPDTYTFNINDILTNSAEIFYIGGGICTQKSYSPGTVGMYITKIWLE